MKFSPKQQEAISKIAAWHKTDEKRFVLAGYAGTGKSTLSKYLSQELGDTMFLAYTGKAANVLREKGNYKSSTIHSALYTLAGEEENEPRFVLNEDSNIKDCDLVIVDEYSMLPEEIIKDLEDLGKKILYLGDPFQLPPVNGECSLKPDFFLDEIHRQALDSNILRYANDVREGKDIPFCVHDDFVYQPKHQFGAEDYEGADQIIVGLNKTRTDWNNRFRLKMGFGDCEFPQKTDKIICTRNNHKEGLFNGMIGECTADSVKVSFQTINLSFDNFKDLKVWDGNFKNREEPPKGKNKFLNRFDFAYAITCHKSQGSEFDDVLVYHQPIGREKIERQRWLYTAITRGKRKVKLVQP